MGEPVVKKTFAGEYLVIVNIDAQFDSEGILTPVEHNGLLERLSKNPMEIGRPLNPGYKHFRIVAHPSSPPSYLGHDPLAIYKVSEHRKEVVLDNIDPDGNTFWFRHGQKIRWANRIIRVLRVFGTGS